MPRKQKRRRRPAAAPNLRWRRGTAYYELVHARLDKGRLVKSIGVKRDREELAISYVSALNTMAERGDWNVLERWRRGELDITDIAHAVREGEYSKIRRVSMEGTRLGDAVDRFIQRARATLGSEMSVSDYEHRLNQLLYKFGRDYPMVDLTVDEAERFLHEPKDSTGGEIWAAHTQTAARTAYGALWQMVIEQEAEAAEKADLVPTVTRNPWKKARIPKKRKTRHSVLTPAQWKQLITHEQVAATAQAAYLACGILGLRQREIDYLRTNDDVILGGARPRLLVQDRQGEFKWKTKTENSVRQVPIPKALLPVFELHRERYAGDEYFFRTWMSDEPMSRGNSRLWVKRCFDAAGIPYGREGVGFTLHSLRHTCATWMLSKNVPLPTAAKRLGDTVTVLLDTYAHALPDDEQRADAVLEEMLQ